MAYQTLLFGVLTAVYFLIRYFNRTDVPKIKGIPEIPGIPIFGNLLQLGDRHATVATKWAKKYGPVFQVRMGNKVWKSNPREFFLSDQKKKKGKDMINVYFRLLT